MKKITKFPAFDFRVVEDKWSRRADIKIYITVQRHRVFDEEINPELTLRTKNGFFISSVNYPQYFAPENRIFLRGKNREDDNTPLLVPFPIREEVVKALEEFKDFAEKTWRPRKNTMRSSA